MKKYYSLRSFWAYLKQFKLRLFLILPIFMSANLALAFIPLFIGGLIDAASADPIVSSDVWRFVIILVICSSLHDILWRVAEFSYMRWLLPIPFHYENGIFKRIILKPYEYFVGKFTGKVASYVTTLRKEFEDLLDKVLWEYVRLTIEAVSVVFIMFTINLTTGLVFLTSVIMLYLIGRFTIRNNLKFEAVYTDADSTKTGKIIDVFGNFVNVKSFAKEIREYKLMLEEQKKVLATRKRSFFWGLIFWGSMSIIIRHVIWPVSIILNVHFFLNGTISIGELATLLSTLVLFSSAIWEFIWEISQFNLMAARIEEAHRYLFGKKVLVLPRHEEARESTEQADMQTALHIQGLSFAYPDQPDQQVLHSVDLQIKKGEKVGIVGHSGSGKTTLVKLLLGYYDHENGSITVDGQQLTSAGLHSLIS